MTVAERQMVMQACLDLRASVPMPAPSSHLDALIRELGAMPEPARIDAINAAKRALHAVSPFANEPVDCVEWVKADRVEANDYNPNAVAPPEMALLATSILADGYTQPIVADAEGERRIVIDGFHRNRVGRENTEVSARVKGYLPVVQIRSTQQDRPDRIASTIRHNRARGKHQVEQMSAIVLELKRRNWSDNKIGKELGMDPDEVLRLAQITGLAEAFKDRDFSMAWETDLAADDAEIDRIAAGEGDFFKQGSAEEEIEGEGG